MNGLGETAHPEGHGETVRLDDEGDLIFVVRDAEQCKSRGFLVPSRLLILAPRAFAKMLGPSFKNGQQLIIARGGDGRYSGRRPHRRDGLHPKQLAL